MHQPGIAAVCAGQVVATHAERACKAQMLRNPCLHLSCLLLKPSEQHWNEPPAAEQPGAESLAAEQLAAESPVVAAVLPVRAAEPFPAGLLVAAAELSVGSPETGAAEPAGPPAVDSTVVAAVSPVRAAEPLPAGLLVAAAD